MARVVIAFILCVAAGLLIMRSWQQHRLTAEAQRAARAIELREHPDRPEARAPQVVEPDDREARHVDRLIAQHLHAHTVQRHRDAIGERDEPFELCRLSVGGDE